MIAANLVGTTLGDYAIEALLGSGGMATVYRGLDRHLQRPVAIKILAAHTAALPGFVARFRREARLIANLRHPNIVQIYTFGEEQGLIYMVQELLPGPTLEQRIAEARRRRQTLPNEEVTTIISQLAAALTAAHKAGVIHRDVKPANALWNTVGALVLTDFGIAKETAATVTQTESGQVIGTPAYMSPEQGQGLALTPATDIYSLGVILFELLTNQVPFTASTPVAVVLQHIHDQPPSLRALRPDLPPAVEAVVQQALAKDPAQRFRSADALATALQQAWVLANVPMHQLPTQAWNPPARPAVPAAQPVSPSAGRTPQLMRFLGLLLLLAFIVGAIVALRDEETVGSAAVDQPAAPSVVAEPTLPPAAPTPASAVDQLRELLAQPGAGPNSAQFVALLDQAQQALDQGDPGAATARLSELQRLLLSDARAGSLDPALLKTALNGIAAIADEHGLTLPLVINT